MEKIKTKKSEELKFVVATGQYEGDSYQIPKFIENAVHEGLFSSGAVLLYMYISDRLINGREDTFVDSNGERYIKFSIAEAKNKIHVCNNTARKLLKQLESAGFIRIKRTGCGNVSQIYLNAAPYMESTEDA